ncbi:hypothetical protein E3N88_45709 [Mikania micrantha]|uniref:Chromo domain-containing protein n=1 Tax=Mikania micrantha TaxID=192012 RepID=A0A5N6L8D5_9ASTR|nr:hypothetical protein E3N88_45709 [Mikania micrantha]
MGYVRAKETARIPSGRLCVTKGFSLERLDSFSKVGENLVRDESAYVPMEDLVIDDKLNYIEKHVAILDRKVKQLRNKTINQVMVQWQNRRGSDATWESEDGMRKFYPFLFEV